MFRIKYFPVLNYRDFPRIHDVLFAGTTLTLLVTKFSNAFISTFRFSFNIFDFHFLKPNLSLIILEHKSRGKMLRNILATACVIFFSVAIHGQENRSYTGYGNNLAEREWGAAHTIVPRISSVNYADGIGKLNSEGLPGPREISNRLFSQNENILDEHKLSDYVWVFGQFIDHDITLVENENSETVLLDIPDDDAFFDPSSFIVTARNKIAPGSGTSEDNPRQFINEISSFIDASAVYGSDKQRADWLRSFSDGKLKTSSGNLLPWNTNNGEYDGEIDPASPNMADDTGLLEKYFVAGDVRANENPLLIGLHTIFVREHNSLCDKLKENHPQWTDEQLYQRARKLVGAYLQNICFYEWLPALGIYLPEYTSYQERMDPSIMNVFSAAAFRIGHTLINSDLIRMDNEGEELVDGSIRLQDAFFNPFAVVHSEGIDPYFKGMGTQVMQRLDCKVIDDLRNFLFGAPGTGGLDLASINIFRGRDRGLPDYNSLRFDFGLPLVKDFSDFTSSPVDAEAMRQLYGSVDKVDAWVGMLAERHESNSIFGELTMRIMEIQFQALRDGDRFYYENDPAFTPSQISEIRNTKLYDIVMRNTDLSVMQKNLFYAMPHNEIPDGPQIEDSPLAAAIFPNPAFDQTTLKLKSDFETTARVSLFNSSGQLLQSFDTELAIGKNFIELNLQEEWPRGLYNVLVESSEHFAIIKLVKE